MPAALFPFLGGNFETVSEIIRNHLSYGCCHVLIVYLLVCLQVPLQVPAIMIAGAYGYPVIA